MQLESPLAEFSAELTRKFPQLESRLRQGFRSHSLCLRHRILLGDYLSILADPAQAPAELRASVSEAFPRLTATRKWNILSHWPHDEPELA